MPKVALLPRATALILGTLRFGLATGGSMMSDDAIHGLGRRQFLRAAVVGAVVNMAGQPRLRLGSAHRPPSRTGLSPDAALDELLAGNRRFAANHLTSIESNLAMLREKTVEKQTPFAGVLACADSRVPVELIFDQSIGQIFTARLAGNMVTPEITASLEYGTAVLGIRTILVLGHSHCGALHAAMKTDTVPGQISALYPHLRAAVKASAGDVEKAIAINAKLQADLLQSSSTVIGQALAAGTLKVAAGVYDLASGKVTLL